MPSIPDDYITEPVYVPGSDITLHTVEKCIARKKTHHAVNVRIYRNQ